MQAVGPAGGHDGAERDPLAQQPHGPVSTTTTTTRATHCLHSCHHHEGYGLGWLTSLLWCCCRFLRVYAHCSVSPGGVTLVVINLSKVMRNPPAHPSPLSLPVFLTHHVPPLLPPVCAWWLVVQEVTYHLTITEDAGFQGTLDDKQAYFFTADSFTSGVRPPHPSMPSLVPGP